MTHNFLKKFSDKISIGNEKKIVFFNTLEVKSYQQTSITIFFR